MNVEEIKKAVDEGKTVHWRNKAYTVIKDRIGQYLIKYNGSPVNYIGLTHRNGVTLNGEENDFFIERQPVNLLLDIDWEQLREQKDALLNVIMTMQEASAMNKMHGLLHLIDSIQDNAVATLEATEKEVFGKYRE